MKILVKSDGINCPFSHDEMYCLASSVYLDCPEIENNMQISCDCPLKKESIVVELILESENEKNT